MGIVEVGGAEPEGLLAALAILDGVVGWGDADARQLVAVDGVELPGDERHRGVTEAGADEVLQVLAPEVSVASVASFGERCVVVFKAMDRAIVGHAYQEGAAEVGVGEPCDGLDGSVLNGAALALLVGPSHARFDGSHPRGARSSTPSGESTGSGRRFERIVKGEIRNAAFAA